MFSTKESILLTFDRIEKDDHQERIRFYEKHSQIIFGLAEEKQHYFTFHYIDSLFSSEKFDHVLNEIDALIEYVFIHNINYLPHRTYEYLLYLKASSFFRMLRYEECIKITEQLVGIQPNNKKYQTLLNQAYRGYFNFASSEVRLSALILIFVSAIISAIFWFVKFNNDQPSISDGFLIVISPCFLAITLLGGAYMYNFTRSNLKASKVIKEKKKGLLQKKF